MAPRAYWKGYLKLSLVSCAVALFPAASRTERIRFNIINRETGNRVHYDVIDAETGEEVPKEDRVKGYKTSDDSYVLLDEDDFDRVALESTHTIDIDAFVARKDVDPLYFDENYFIAPDDKVGVEAFAVIREAMAHKGLVGLARVVLHRREQILMLQPRDKGIVATTLRFANEVREADTYFEDIPGVKIAPDMLELAEHILQTKKAKFDPTTFEDRYETALSELIAAKQAGEEPPEAPPPKPSNVINLMDALRRSVKAGKGEDREERPAKAARRGAAKASKRSAKSSRRAGRKAAPKRRLKKAG